MVYSGDVMVDSGEITVQDWLIVVIIVVIIMGY